MASARQQVALSLIAVVGVPVLVGQAVAPATEAAKTTETEKAKAALTVELDSKEQKTSDTARLLIRAIGSPPKRPSVLTSTSGLTTTEATRATDCEGLESRQASATLAGRLWCIALDGIPDGSSVSGSLSGTNTELTLTVNRPLGFWGIPLAVILAGLVVGGLAILVPKLLRRSTRTALLEALLERNDAAGDRRIEDLSDWVTDQRSKGKSDDEILPVAADLFQRGPGLADEARNELRLSLGQSSLPSEHPARKAAKAELTRTNLRADFIDSKNEIVTHPALLLAGVIKQLGVIAPTLMQLDGEIKALPEDRRAAPSSALEVAQARFDISTTTEDIDKLGDKLDEVRQAIALAKRQPAPAIGTMRMAGGFALDLGGNLIAGVPLAGGRPSGWAWVKRFAFPLALSTAVLFVVGAWAVLTVKVAVYDPKPAFACSDCLALFIAALGSGAAGSILGTITIWDPLSAAAKE